MHLCNSFLRTVTSIKRPSRKSRITSLKLLRSIRMFQILWLFPSSQLHPVSSSQVLFAGGAHRPTLARGHLLSWGQPSWMTTIPSQPAKPVNPPASGARRSAPGPQSGPRATQRGRDPGAVRQTGFLPNTRRAALPALPGFLARVSLYSKTTKFLLA